MSPSTTRISTRPRYRWARAYRNGELVCGRVDLRVWDSGRLGLTAHERREVAVRFLERLAPGFRRELDALLRRRGDVARRIAERMEAIELVADHTEMGDLRIVGHVQPPQRRHGEIYEIEFGLRELPVEQAAGTSPAARAPGSRIGRVRPVVGRGDG
jgi:hypothetical protein